MPAGELASCGRWLLGGTDGRVQEVNSRRLTDQASSCRPPVTLPWSTDGRPPAGEPSQAEWRRRDASSHPGAAAGQLQCLVRRLPPVDVKLNTCHSEPSSRVQGSTLNLPPVYSSIARRQKLWAGRLESRTRTSHTPAAVRKSSCAAKRPTPHRRIPRTTKNSVRSVTAGSPEIREPREVRANPARASPARMRNAARPSSRQ